MCSQECVLYLMVSFCIVWVFLAGDKTKTYPNKQQQGKKHLSLYTGSVFSMSWILCCSVTQSCPTLKDLMDFMTAGFPVHHDLSELAQTRVHWVGDAIQPSLPLSSPSPPTFNPSQNQGLFKWISSSHQVAKVLEFQFQHQSFQWIFRTDLL